MQWTPEQQTQLAQAKSVGEKRAAVSFTPQQKAVWEAAVQQELAGRVENLDRLRKIKAGSCSARSVASTGRPGSGRVSAAGANVTDTGSRKN